MVINTFSGIILLVFVPGTCVPAWTTMSDPASEVAQGTLIIQTFLTVCIPYFTNESDSVEPMILEIANNR